MKLSGQYISVSIDGNDVSSDVDSVEIPDEYSSLDMTGFGDGSENSQPGMPKLPIKINGVLNPATNRLFDVCVGLVGVNSGVTIIVSVGQYATPTTGDPKFSGTFWLQNLPVSADPKGKVTLSGLNFEVYGATAPAWGTV